MIVVCDIDGTISTVGDRLKYIKQDPKDWDKFYAACGEDKPKPDVIDIVNQLSLAYEIVFLTGRMEHSRPATVKWLMENVSCYTNNWQRMKKFGLHMRAVGDHRHDTEVKPELLEKRLDMTGETVLCILEDRNSMVAKWRELGYTCLQVADGDF